MEKIWWTLTIFGIVVFGGLATSIYTREVDAAGVVQTFESKWISLALLVVYLLSLLYAILYFYLLLIKEHLYKHVYNVKITFPNARLGIKPSYD